jgi:polar amino acid transport system substrate-binding protein
MFARSKTTPIHGLVLGALIALAGAWTGPAAADALDAILEQGVVRIAVPRDLPPFGALDEAGQIEGYDVEVAKLLAGDLGVRLELRPVTSVERVPALLTHQVDLIIANLGVNPERAKAVAFSIPYAPFFSGIFGAPGLAVSAPGNLAGRTIAVTRDTLEDAELTKLAPGDARILRFDDNQATMTAFLSGEAELVATGNVVVAALARLHPDTPVATKLRLRESPGSIGVRRSEPELRDWVNVFVYHKKLSGDLDRLARSWFGEPLPPLPVF